MTSHGYIYLPAGARLYMATRQPVDRLPDSHVVHLALHPFDCYYMYATTYISVITLVKSIKVRFMVNAIKGYTIYNTLRGSRTYDVEQLGDCEGWFTTGSMRYKGAFVIVNRPDVVRFESCGLMVDDWAYSRMVDGQCVPAEWGSTYPIACRVMRFRCEFEEGLRGFIEDFLKFLADEDPGGLTLGILLESAEVVYY